LRRRLAAPASVRPRLHACRAIGQKFVTFYRAVPGRESYDVVIAEMPGVKID